MKISVLHVVNIFESGGIREFIMNYFRNVDHSKFDFYFLVQRDYSIPEDDEIIQLGGHIIFGPRMYKNELEYYKFLKNFLIKNQNIKIIHSHLNLRNLIPLAAAKKALVPMRIAHCHKSENNENALQYIKRRILSYMIKRYASVKCACSKNAAKYLFGHDEDVQIINNAIDTEKFKYNAEIRSTLRKEYNFNNELIVGHIGNFSDEKNHFFIIEVFKEVMKIRDDAFLVLIGNGEHFKEIETIVTENKLLNKHVLLLGTKKDVYCFYQMFDLFIFPSLSEGFGMAILEAECAGLPIVVSEEIKSEACTLGLCNKLSLNANPKQWAMKLLGIKRERNNYAAEIIKRHGYDIYDNVNRLEELYLKILE